MKSRYNCWPYTDLGSVALPTLSLLCFGLREACEVVSQKVLKSTRSGLDGQTRASQLESKTKQKWC